MNNEEIKVFINITETLEDKNRIPQYQITLNFINRIKTPEICNNITKKHFEIPHALRKVYNIPILHVHKRRY
jgi:hypothetical protein